MRGLHARRLASTALCAAVLVGVAGPAAVAADSAGERAPSTSQSAVPGAEKLLAQVKALNNSVSVVQPVVDLLNASLQQGKLSPEQARKLGEAARRAIAEAAKANADSVASTTTLPSTATIPSASTATSTHPAEPAAPPALAAPAALVLPPAVKHADDGKPSSSRDLAGDALSSLQSAVDGLLKAVTSDLSSVLSTATGVVSGLLNLLTGTLGLAAPASSSGLLATG
ncbi:hypothetical protein [Streptomyces sp. MMG1121]|uniref:hypothetical protein n=1 Tax=Streptomyces sp. MMG1121 TaxID=1415544 RepID=UPI0006AEB381|nr:hypothetical protein [Streptomyces sp. MMG1121]KOV58320.1 hypothetical protein ADK64_36380 [Streptomyces sp. MMG1121]